MTIYKTNWDTLKTLEIIDLFSKIFYTATFLPTNDLVSRLRELKEEKCELLENRTHSTIYCLVLSNEFYKIDRGNTIKIRKEDIQTCSTDEFIIPRQSLEPNYCIYSLGEEIIIEHLKNPRFKALVDLDAEIILLKIKFWIDSVPQDQLVIKKLLKAAYLFSNLNRTKARLRKLKKEISQHWIINNTPTKVNKRHNSEKGKKTKYVDDVMSTRVSYKVIKKNVPEYCIYDVFGEKFIEHQIHPRFKAKIISSNENVLLKVVLWIDKKPHKNLVIDNLIANAYNFLNNYQLPLHICNP